MTASSNYLPSFPAARREPEIAPSEQVPEPAAHAARAASEPARTSPFASLRNDAGGPLKVAILSDFTRIPYANGAVFQTRALYQALDTCGHQTTVVGPRDPDARPDEVPARAVLLPSLPLRTYPGVHLPLPTDPTLFDPARWDFDLCFAQTTSLLLELGVWMKKVCGVPLLSVNTTHLAAAYEVLLPERAARVPAVHAALQATLRRPMERVFSDLYNQGDGLVVLSEGMRTYWRDCGVTVPIHVVPRMVQEAVFDRPSESDPYLPWLAERGLPARAPRIVCAGRHTREKAQDRVIRVFARHVAPFDLDAALFLVGDGPDREGYERLARDLGVSRRVIFTGEVPFDRMPDHYRHADLFLHASLSETFGNVVGEALWCGTPLVGFADGMGVSSQVESGVNGLLLDPGRGGAEAEADAALGRATVELLRDHVLRARLAAGAARRARERSSPAVVEAKLAAAFRAAREHARESNTVPLANGPKLEQWLETARHARSWAASMAGLYLVGHLRPVPKRMTTGRQPPLRPSEPRLVPRSAA